MEYWATSFHISKEAKTNRSSSKENQIHPFIFQHIGYIINSLKFIGALPLQKMKNGEYEFKIFSQAGLYAFAFQSVIAASASMVVWDNMAVLQKNVMVFDDTITLYGAILFLGFHFLPIFNIFEGKKVASYFTSWMHYQIKYHKLTGKWFLADVEWTKRVFLLTLVVTTIGHLYFVFTTLKNLSAKYGVILTGFRYIVTMFIYGYYWWVILIYATWWFTMTIITQQAARNLLKDLQNVLHKRKSPSEIFALWVDLKNLTDDLGTTYTVTYSFFLAYLFLSMLATSYTFITSLASADRKSNWTFIIFTALLFGIYSIIVGGAHRTTIQVKGNFNTTLFKLLHEEKNVILEKEIKWFLQTIAICEEHMSLCGYVILNRQSTISMLQTMLSYLIVVLQFKLSSDQANGNQLVPMPTESSW